MTGISQECTRAPSKRGRYWEIHPRCPRDVLTPETRDLTMLARCRSRVGSLLWNQFKSLTPCWERLRNETDRKQVHVCIASVELIWKSKGKNLYENPWKRKLFENLANSKIVMNFSSDIECQPSPIFWVSIKRHYHFAKGFLWKGIQEDRCLE